MIQNIQGRLKMKFPQYDCFPANCKADSKIAFTTCF